MKYKDIENKLIADISTNIKEYTQNMNELEFRKATQSLHAIFMLANAYIAEKEPWKKAKEGDMKDAEELLKTEKDPDMVAMLNDEFYEGKDKLKKVEDELFSSGQIDEEGNRLIANSQSNGRFHSTAHRSCGNNRSSWRRR